MKKPLFALKVLPAALLFSSIALAEDSVHLSPMVVYSKPEFRFSNAPNATHLDEEDLQRSGQRELSQVLRAEPGLSIAQGMKGGPNNLSLRGRIRRHGPGQYRRHSAA